MNGFTITAVSNGITPAVTVGSGPTAVTTCGTGNARIRRIERKGTSTLERRQFVLKDGPIVPVVNPDPISHPAGVKIKLGFDECGVHVVINNVCE